MDELRLSANFELAELQVSQTASRRGLPNVAPPEAVAELQRLVTLILQPLRDRIARPIVVLSGYRSPEVNAAVGGAKNSAHMRGQAADIIVPGMTPLDVCRAIVAWQLPFDQLIYEFGPGGWTHVAVTPAGVSPRREVLTAVKEGGRTVYRKGLP